MKFSDSNLKWLYINSKQTATKKSYSFGAKSQVTSKFITRLGLVNDYFIAVGL